MEKLYIMILAQKGNLKKHFSQLSWDNLGENKNGWKEVNPNITVSDIGKNAQTPPTGNPEKTEKPKDNIVVDNILDKTKDIVVDDATKTGAGNNTVDEFIEKQKAEFTTVAKEGGLTKNQIKDYFDSEEVNVAYKASDNLDTLIDLLFNKLSGDVEALKTKFSL